MDSIPLPLLSTNETLYQWSTVLQKQDPEAKDILVTTPLPGKNLAISFSELHYNKMFISHNITSSLDGFHFNHQLLASRYMVLNDVLMLMHEPGTGKTRTQLYAMLVALSASLIKRILIINRSTPANDVAIKTLQTLYIHEFAIHFEMPFSKFLSKYVTTRTIRKLNDYATEDHTGIIIDEAHLIFTEDEAMKTKKRNILKMFVKSLNDRKGIKLILSTATPIFGNVKIVSDYMRLIFRTETPMKMYQVSDFLPGMLSYTAINYNHIRIKQVMNDRDERSEKDQLELKRELIEGGMSYQDAIHNLPKKIAGDRSFDLEGNYGYHELKLFMTQPSPMQIADLASIALGLMKKKDKREPFNYHIKPVMAASKRNTGNIVYESAIVDAIIERTNRTEYGLTVIYCNLKRDGTNEIAAYMETKGIKRYNPNEQRDSDVSESASPSIVLEIEDHIRQHRERINALRASMVDIDKADLEAMRITIEELETQQLTSVNPYTIHISNLPYSQEVLTLMKRKYMQVLAAIKNENEKHREIEDLESIIIELKAERDLELDKHHVKLRQRNNDHRYFIFTPSMKAVDKLIFEKINSPENWNGSIVKYVIGSQVMRDGTDIKHGVRIDIVIPEWRIPGLIQAQHRIIRSNGHNEIIYRLALRKMNAARQNHIPLTIKQAQEEVRKEGIDVHIYNHVFDVSRIDRLHIDNASRWFSQDLNEYIEANYGNDSEAAYAAIIKAIKSKTGIRGGMKLYDSAIKRHYQVGRKQIEMCSSAIDYMLNVRKDMREAQRDKLGDEVKDIIPVDSDEVHALGATEMFFPDYHIRKIIEDIKVRLLINNVINTDDLFDDLLKIPGYTQQIIAKAITTLVERDRYVYNEGLGINMMISLHANENESILYLTTTSDESNHPYNHRVSNIQISIIEQFRRVPTTVDVSDLHIPKRPDAFYKLYDLIERASKQGYQLTENEFYFLIQMSNYWMVLEKDLRDPRMKAHTMKYYIIEKHISRPSIDILSKNLLIHEFDPTNRDRGNPWRVTQTLSIGGQKFVRFAKLAQNYRDYQPEQTSHTYNGKSSNGMILTKSTYTTPAAQKPSRGRVTQNEEFERSLTYRLLQPESALMSPYEKTVVHKKVGDDNTRGYQFVQDPAFVGIKRSEMVKKLYEITKNNMYMLFFVYNSIDSTGEQRSGDTLRSIKMRELEVIDRTKQGRPIPMFQIEWVERNYTTEENREKMYSLIYKDHLP